MLSAITTMGDMNRPGSEMKVQACLIWPRLLTEAAQHRISAVELGNHIKSVIGVTARITITDPGGIERSQGKARRVIDKRPRA